MKRARPRRRIQHRGQVDVLVPPYILGAAVIGPLHVQHSLPCQDACAYRVHSSGLVAVAVADGLGSAARSQVGARIAVDAAVTAGMDAAQATLDGTSDLTQITKSAAVAARRAVEARARLELCDLRDLACTLIVLAALRDRIAVAHIGDGAVVALVGSDLVLVSGPGDAEYTNEVVPITAKEWLESLRVTLPLGGVDCFAVLTDGCQRAGFRRGDGAVMPYDRFFVPVFSYAKELKTLREGEEEITDLLLSDKVCNNSDDDKTLVIAVLRRQVELHS